MLSDKIQSIRETMSGGYRKPEQAVLDVLIEKLNTTNEAKEYLYKRGIINDTIKHFKLGYDATKNAISIPVFKHGELVNIRYRSIDPDAKQRYTQEKGCEVWLYNDEGIQEGIKKGGVLVVEGEFDLMSVWQSGITNVISPSSGKDSYGPWIELLDNIKKVYIAYDNDKPGKAAGIEMANRIGVDKSFEVTYPDGFKDANEYFMTYSVVEFKQLIKDSRPYYKHQYKGVGDVITMLRENKTPYLELFYVPYVKFEDDWVAVLSGKSNSGKTTWTLNIAQELLEKDLPVLLLPFERGIKSVGQRFLQVRYKKQVDDFFVMKDAEWDKIRDDSVSLPMYFAMPSEKDFEDTVRRAKRLFNIKVCIIDHLDYFVRGADKISKQADVIRKIKDLAQELQVIFLVVHHLKKGDGHLNLAPVQEDLIGSSDIYKVAEVVALLHKKDDGQIDVKIDKNKGEQGTRTFLVDMSTGVFKREEYHVEKKPVKENDDDW